MRKEVTFLPSRYLTVSPYLVGVVLLLTLFKVATVHSNEAIKYHVANRLNDPQRGYFIHLLQQACIVAEPKYGTCNLQPVMASMHQSRQLLSLNHDILSIMWTATNEERESNYLPIRIPLTMGLIGARIAVLNEQAASTFTPDSNINEIRRLPSAQGHDWPDLPILKHNQFNVAGINWNDSVYRMLSKQVFDIIFRSVLEVDAELKQQTVQVHKDVHHLFYYPSAIYFFVSRDNHQLHERIRFGLMELAESGRLKSLLLEYPNHSGLRKMLYEEKRKIHFLENPFLPKETPLDKPQYWLFNSTQTD